MLKNTSKAYPINFQAAGFAGLGGQINKDAFPNRFRRCTKDAVGQHQIKLAPVNAPCFDGAKLLIAADCTAYAYANIYQEFMRVKIHLNQAGIHFLN